ncbi:MAG: YhbY family RNA-binding protein [Euryarchaeota archaeon]|jgi:RNA-binding protein|nr:RNA-binding protein [Euryarchaeota archaeon]|tara:strand:+ start:1898 stop:2167 length:270 start_codon:yes stop_codon:yes gene_type:complete
MSSVPNHIKKMANDRELVVSVRVGRNGLTDAIFNELTDQLNKRKLVKIKANKGILEGSSDRTSLFSEIAEKTESVLVFQRGNVAVFWKS